MEKQNDARIEDAATHAGTIIESKDQTGRAALRPQPSNDPNDPLVRVFLLVPSSLLHQYSLLPLLTRITELDDLSKVDNIWHHLLFQLHGHR